MVQSCEEGLPLAFQGEATPDQSPVITYKYTVNFISLAISSSHILTFFKQKADQGDEKQQLLTKHDFPPQAHPLSLFEIISHKLVQGQPPKVLQPQSPKREEKQVLEHEEDASEQEEVEEQEAAATTIQQRFLTIPLALKGLVRLQALVRGHLVRRQAAKTLRTMEAIVRVQAVFRGRPVRMCFKGGLESCKKLQNIKSSSKAQL